MNKIYDYIIVGGGIAGLYANYKLSKNKKNNILLFEAEKEFGGRTYEMKFHDSLIKTGAGIFIKDNKNLNKLLKELNIKPNTFETFNEVSCTSLKPYFKMCAIRTF